jgi:hypothetical protein
VDIVSESDKKDGEEAGAPEEQASGDPKNRRINDPLTSKDVESPRTSWQPQRPSPQPNRREGHEAGDTFEGGN